MIRPAQRINQALRKNRYHYFFTVILFCFLLGAAAIACTAKEPLRIGFVGELTGKGANMSVGQRNGVVLAIEEINQSGGINGRKIELISMDDEGKPETAQAVDAQLVQQGVLAIIGHSTSAQTQAALSIINPAQVVMISPTTASTQFSNIDDYLFRITPDTRQFAHTLASYILKQNLHHLVSINEQKNSAFTQQIFLAVQEELKSDRSIDIQSFLYTEGETDLVQLSILIHAANPDGIIFLSPGIDTALIAQYLRMWGSSARFFASHWSQSIDLIPKGGQAVEGMVISASFNPQNENPHFLSFKQRFIERYRVAPNFVAVFGYESMQVLAEGLRIAEGNPKKLKQALINIQDFPGIQGTIHLTPYGDCIRETYLIQIREGEYHWLETVPPLP